MSKLSFFGRPWVVFNAGNRQHRNWYAEFQRTSTWSKCPVRFYSDDESGDLIAMIQRQLIEYYTNREFKSIKVLT